MYTHESIYQRLKGFENVKFRSAVDWFHEKPVKLLIAYEIDNFSTNSLCIKASALMKNNVQRFQPANFFY